MDFNEPDTKKPSLGAHEPTEDVESTRIDPRLPERPTHTSYDRSKRYRSGLTSSSIVNHDDPATDERLGAHHTPSNDSKTNNDSLNAL